MDAEGARRELRGRVGSCFFSVYGTLILLVPNLSDLSCRIKKGDGR